jgi:hypothetical protein
MEQHGQVIFDAAREIALQVRTAGGIKAVRVRFPSDEEWVERQRRRKVVIKQLGRGKSETSIPHAERVDEELLAKIRLEDGPEIDAFEAARIVEELSTAEVDDVTAVAEGYRIVLRVPGGLVGLVLAEPSAKDVFEYRRSFARLIDLPFGKQEMTVNLRAAGELFKKLVKSTEGYAGDVPIIHQTVAVKATIDAQEAGFEDEGPAANFR